MPESIANLEEKISVKLVQNDADLKVDLRALQLSKSPSAIWFGPADVKYSRNN